MVTYRDNIGRKEHVDVFVSYATTVDTDGPQC